jgi:hypothetical protein
MVSQNSLLPIRYQTDNSEFHHFLSVLGFDINVWVPEMIYSRYLLQKTIDTHHCLSLSGKKQDILYFLCSVPVYPICLLIQVLLPFFSGIT